MIDIFEKLRECELPIIIFGASVAGDYVYEKCIENDIEIECFCDNNLQKQKTSVLSLAEVKQKYKQALFLIACIDIHDVVTQLNQNGYVFWESTNEILKDISHNTVSNLVLAHDNFLHRDKVFLRGVDVIITERCSLRCKDCSNLMSYYESPKDGNVDTVIQEITNLCNIVDKIGEIRIIGGEPFMHRQMHKIIEPFLTNSKIDSVVIFTNSTILPTEEQLVILRHKKVSFFMSDYGELSKKFAPLCKMLTKNKIPFITADIRWTDCSRIFENKRTIEENQKIFDECCVKNFYTLSNNKLYRCPFFANADRLKAIPKFENEYIDLSKEVSKEEIKNHILSKKVLRVCDFCNGRSYNDPEIPNSVQLKQPKPYKKYQE